MDEETEYLERSDNSPRLPGPLCGGLETDKPAWITLQPIALLNQLPISHGCAAGMNLDWPSCALERGQQLMWLKIKLHAVDKIANDNLSDSKSYVDF